MTVLSEIGDKTFFAAAVRFIYVFPTIVIHYFVFLVAVVCCIVWLESFAVEFVVCNNDFDTLLPTPKKRKIKII